MIAQSLELISQSAGFDIAKALQSQTSLPMRCIDTNLCSKWTDLVAVSTVGVCTVLVHCKKCWSIQ